MQVINVLPVMPLNALKGNILADRWVQLKTLKNIERHGKLRAYHPGDWVAVGKSTALRWIAEGEAFDPKAKIREFVGDDFGVRIMDKPGIGRNVLSQDGNGDPIPTAIDGPLLPWELTLIWDPKIMLRKELLSVGFNFLEIWQVACPLMKYDIMANNTGTLEDRDLTADLIGDLRIPLYNPSLMFVKRCGDTRAMIGAWEEEKGRSPSIHHALLRAIYRTKPLILALPPNWTDPNYLSSADDW